MATVDEILTRQAYAAGEETWTKDNNYPSYTLYVEPEYVTITNKRIDDFNDRISVRGEQNARFVGFQLPRYDDGIDLTAQHLHIHYQTVYGGSDSIPCNVSWTDNYIRLCWQVPAQATQEPDRVQMMIYATGTNSMGERVTWKTLPTSYTIHDGLDIGGGIPEPDTSWYEQFVQQMEGKASTAQGYADDAQASRTEAAGSATAAAQSATASAQALEDNKAYVESQKETFVGYNKREADLKYANALVGSASGTGRITIGDAWEAPIPGMDITGRSKQFSTTGAQLLVYPYYNTTKTQNGITFTALDDGRVSIKGTVTGNNATYILQQNLILPPGTYTKNNPGTIKYMISRYLNGAFDRVEVSQNDVTFDTDGWDYDVYEYKPLLQTVTVGDTFDNLIVSPMLNAGATAKPWEPYTGGKPSPTPDYPQPIISTGTVTTGAQMLDTEKIQYPASVPTIISDNGRTIQVSGGVATGRAMYDIGLEKVIGRTVYVSGTIASKSVSDAKTVIVLCVQKADDSWEYKYIRDIGIKVLIYVQIPNDAKQVRLDFNINDSNAPLTTVNTAVFKDVMISVDTPKPWEPYTGGKPGPSPEYPQTMAVTVKGEQLLNLDGVEKQKTVAGITYTIDGQNGTITANGTATDIAILSLPISIPEGEKVYIGAGNSSTTPSGNIQVLLRLSGDNGVEASSNTYLSNQNATNIFITTKYCNLFQFRIGPGETVNNFVIKPMIAPSDKPLSWQPYQSGSATIPLMEPLHGIGDVRDRIMCRDGVWGIERKYNRMIFDGSEDEIWNDSTTEASDKKRYNCKVSGRQADIRHQTALCSHFRLIETGTTFKNVCGFTIANDYIQLYLDGRPINEFKAWLQENPTTLVYQLSTPTWEPFPSDTQSALNALTTYTGTSHVTITAGGPEPDVGLEYVMDTRAVIEDLQAQIDAIRNGGTT